MVYCGLDDIKGEIPEIRIIELTDDDSPNSSGSINLSIVNNRIEKACTTVDGYLRARFTLPLPSVPPIIKSLATDLAVYHLYERLTEMNCTEGMILRYNKAIKMLEKIADGTIPIGIEEQDDTAEGFPTAVLSPGPPMFPMEFMP